MSHERPFFTNSESFCDTLLGDPSASLEGPFFVQRLSPCSFLQSTTFMSASRISARWGEAGTRPTYLQLLTLLRDGHTLTQADMTDRLPIDSKRQARRLIDRLRSAGIAIHEEYRDGRKAYWLSPEEWEAEVRLDLTEREALALMLAAGAAESGLGPAPLKKALSSAVEHLVTQLPALVSTFEPTSLLGRLHFGEAASVDVDPGVFMELVDALSNRRSIEMDYYSASSDRYDEGRRVDPWGLAVRGDAWLCVAHDHRSGERRDFNVTRIEAVRPYRPDSNGGDYRIPEDFDLELYFIDRFEALDAEEVYEVRLLLEPDVVPYFESKSYHRTQQLHDAHPLGTDDDRVVASFEVAGLEEIASFVRSWGTSVTVLAPEALASRIASDAREVAARYDGDGPRSR